MLHSATASHAMPPTKAPPHAIVVDLPWREFGVLNWVFGVLILVLFRNLATLTIWDLSLSKPLDWTQHKDTNLTHSGCVLFFIFIYLFYFYCFVSIWLSGKFAKSFCVLKFHVLIGYL